MRYPKMREELRDYYLKVADDRSMKFLVECTKKLDSLYKEDMSVYDMKILQYRTITDMFDPVLFYNSPFYYETGTMCAQCDGAREWRWGLKHAGGWTYWKNFHMFQDQDPQLWEMRQKQAEEIMYTINVYNDVSQHFVFNHRPILEKGLVGVYEEAKKALDGAQTNEEKEFLIAMCEGLLSIKRIGEKFSEKAKLMKATAPDDASRENLERIADTAARVPWQKPESFYEALCTLAFMRKAIGSLEGIGINSFGRLDVDLYPFYKKDTQSGVLTYEKAYDLVCQFLITWDMHYDHDMQFVYYSDHELENTYELGGNDASGNEVYNEITKMFLAANYEEKIIFPKIKCRFSRKSPKEYLDLINEPILSGTTTILYQNDDATIPALIRAGRTKEEAVDYIISGCWDVNCLGVEKIPAGYVNILKAFEFSLHNRTDKMEKVGMYFRPFDGAESFEEIYKITCENIMTLLEARADVTRRGGRIWHKVDPVPIFSSTLESCMEKRLDYTAGGAKYNDDGYKLCGFVNIVDSLLAIRELCFEKKKYTLSEMLTAVRSNWEGYEEMRLEAVKCHGWGDGSDEATSFAKRFHEDLYAMTEKLTATFGGKVLLSFLNYTEIRWWGEKTLATPEGRKNGEYIVQGLTPSRLKKIPVVTDVINSFAELDPSLMGDNSVVNIILPHGKINLDTCEAFMRTVAMSAVQSLQLNCTSREQLLDAQKHPEKYPDLIIRVTGFSAKFTSLSPEWQNEVITRNFYE